jgi:hypothetical protein
MQFSPFSRLLIPLRSKYPPQHPVLKHSHGNSNTGWCCGGSYLFELVSGNTGTCFAMSFKFWSLPEYRGRHVVPCGYFMYLLLVLSLDRIRVSEVIIWLKMRNWSTDVFLSYLLISLDTDPEARVRFPALPEKT